MTTTLQRCQYLDGFIPIGPVDNIVSMSLAAVSVTRGDLLIDDGDGYLTNASITGFSAETAYYVAMETVDNSGGSVGDLDILCVYANGANIEFWAAVEDELIVRTDVGTIVDANSEDGVKVGTAVTNTGIGFLITGFDAGTAAVAANTYGYAKGRFHILGETS
jgi:hypothetical protein